jgi:hypothetical protein
MPRAWRSDEAKQIKPGLSRQQKIGNYVDERTRHELRRLYDRLNVSYGKGQNITINNRDYDTSQPGKPMWTVLDARIGDISFDWTLSPKNVADKQIRGFFNADSTPKGVVIIRPSQIQSKGSSYIPKPPVM